ncbi:MAG: hypothetical protein WEF53_08565 [Bacteroidota bacterium]
MKISVKFTKSEMRKLEKLKKEAQILQKQLERAYAKMEKAWKTEKAPEKITKVLVDTTHKAQQSIKEIEKYYSKLKKKFR